MGYLGWLFAWMHPIRHLSRRAKRSITPRPIRRALRAKDQILHPIESAERSVFRAADRAITPRKSRRKPQQPRSERVGGQIAADNRVLASPIGSAQPRIDPLMADAARLIAHRQWVSVSWLVERLGISYTRAAQVMDQLEAHRIVSAYVGAAERSIMMPAIEIEELLGALGFPQT